MLLAENVVIAERFRLTRLIGKGGMGSVWQAQHLGLDIPCAVKFIEGELAKVPEMQARFEREAKAAAQLRSPHVVQILDHGVCEGTPYIAMELLEGEDLGKRFQRVRTMPPAEFHMVISQVCRALTKAHALGIVHRDLKPDNIFLVRDDDREIAKVLDFGIAKTTSVGATGGNTRTGAMLGTPFYMSPEQAQGTRAVDHRSDLWSLAVICFQGLTGRLPFQSDALGDLLMRIMVAEMPVPSRSGCTLPGMDEWWRRAAARDPGARFQSAKEFSDAFGVACGVPTPTVHERSASTLPEIPANTPVDASASGSMQAVAAASAAQIALGATTPAPISSTFSGSGPLPQKKSSVPLKGAGVALLVTAGLVSFAMRSRSTPEVAGAGATPPVVTIAGSAVAATGSAWSFNVSPDGVSVSGPGGSFSASPNGVSATPNVPPSAAPPATGAAEPPAIPPAAPAPAPPAPSTKPAVPPPHPRQPGPAKTAPAAKPDLGF